MKTVAIALAVTLLAVGVLAPTATATTLTTAETDETTDCVQWAVNTVLYFVATGTIRPAICT